MAGALVLIFPLHLQGAPVPAPAGDVQRKLLAGEPIAFEAQSEESQRSVEAAWIQEAVGKSIRVDITNAVITGRLNLTQITTERPLILTRCKIGQRPDLSNATFKNRVVFAQCSFEKGAGFRNAVFHSDVSFAGTEFCGGPADFVDVNSQGTFDGTGFHFHSDSQADFTRAIFARTALFNEAVFEADAEFANAHFGGQSHFQSVLFKKKANFYHLRAEGDASFRAQASGEKRIAAAKFEGEADFSGAKFRGSVEFQGTTFHQKLSFNGAEVAERAFFCADAEKQIRGPIFEGEADFTYVHFGASAYFTGSVFKQRAVFDSARFDKYAAFSALSNQCPAEEGAGLGYGCGVCFEGDAIFAGAVIGLQAQFQGTVFLQKASFWTTKIGASALFSAFPDENMAGAIFEGEANFYKVEIGGDAFFQGATFKEIARFDAAEIHGMAVFRADLDPTNLNLVKIQGTRFEKGVEFANAHIVGPTQFQGVTFGGNANFYRTRFDANADFFTVQRNEAPAIFERDAIFEDTQIKGNTNFKGAIFKGRANFAGARLESFASFASQEESGAPTIFQSEADFREVRFGGNALFADTVFEQHVRINHSQCDAVLDFVGALFWQGISLGESVVRVLHFSRNGRIRGTGDKAPEQFQGAVDMRGCQYEQLYEQVDRNTNWRVLTKQFAPYDRQPYRQLEKAFRAAGQDEMADHVFLEQQNREREIKWTNGDYGGWFSKWLHWRLLHYGVRPYRLVLYAAILLALGWWIFVQPGALEKKDREGTRLRVSWRDAMGATLRYFFPIDVVMGSRFVASHQAVPLLKKVWARKRSPRIRPTTYATILQIAGWILVPLSVAALAGLLKVS